MSTSYNGYRVGTQASLGIKALTVPGSQVVLPVLPSTAPALLWVAEQVDKRVKNIDVAEGHRTPDDWGYAYRATRGATNWSNHASGTAIDLNATQWPRGVYRMSDDQIRECRRIRGEINTAGGKRIVDWGGDYQVSPIDQMHWEIAYGATPVDVRRAVLVLRAPPKPKPTPVAVGNPPKLWLHMPKRYARKHEAWIKKAQRRLGLKPDGIFGPVTRRHVLAYRRAHHLRPHRPPVIGSRMWKLLLKEKP